MDKGLEEKLLRLLDLAGYADYESRALASLVLFGDATPSDLASRTGLPKSKMYDILDSLEQKSCVYQVTMGKKRYRAIRPEELVPRLMTKAKDMEAIKTDIDARLVEVYEGAQEVGPGARIEALVQILAGRSARSSSLLGAFKAAKEEILIVDEDLAWAVPGTSLGDQLKLVASKVRLLATAEVPRDSVISLQAVNMQARQTSNLTSSFVVVDRRDAWLFITGASDGPACIHVEQRGLAEDLVRLFNQAWETARGVTA